MWSLSACGRTALALVALATAANFFMTASARPLPNGPRNEPWANSASGDDGRVRVTVSVYRDRLAPGENARISATSEMLVDGPLRFPQGYHQPLAFLYLRTPAGKVFVYPDRGVSPRSFRALEAKDYIWPFLFKKGIGGLVLSHDIPLVHPSPGWLDPKSFDSVRPNLRAEGVYEAWVRYTIPRVEGVPDDAWHGTVETGRVRFTVREIPVAQRRDKATAEQIAHLAAYMKSIDALDKNMEVETPKAEEMPNWLSLEQRVQWALERTENEGFARHTVAMLAQHQPKDKDQPYPRWWSNVSFFVIRSRAYCEGYESNTLRIIGPYLEEFALIGVKEVELELARTDHEGLGIHYYLDLLLDFVEREPKSPVRARLETLARSYARIPADVKPHDHKTRQRLATSWKILLALGVLRDGMLFAEAKKILGEPTWKKDDAVLWNYGTGSRRFEPGVVGRIVVVDGRETIVFTRHSDWIH
jgi:hypothetical protein